MIQRGLQLAKRLSTLPYRRLRARLRQQAAPEGLSLNGSFTKVEMGGEELERMMAWCKKELDRLESGGKFRGARAAEGKDFVFVVGSPRTGGVYTTQILMDTLCSYEQGDAVVRDESIPDFYSLANFHRSEQAKRNALFQFLQWIYWVLNKYPGQDVIVKKCSGLSFQMDILSTVLPGANIHVLLTTRHPGAVYRSGVDVMERYNRAHPIIPITGTPYTFLHRSPPDWWQNAGWKLRALHYWHKVYQRFIDTLPADVVPNTSLIEYGHQEEAIRSAVSKLDSEAMPTVEEKIADDPFRETERSYADFWRSAIVDDLVEGLDNRYAKRDLEFPVDSTRIA